MALHCDFLTRGIQRHQEKCSSRLGKERSIYFTCGLILSYSASRGMGLSLHRTVHALFVSMNPEALKGMPNTYPFKYQLLEGGDTKHHHLTYLTSTTHVRDTTKCTVGSRGCLLVSFTHGVVSAVCLITCSRYKLSQGSHRSKVERAQGGWRKLEGPNFHKHT